MPTKSYFQDSKDAAEFVADRIQYFVQGSPLTMTISRDRSGACYVLSAIEELLEDTALQTARFFSETQVNT